MSTKYNGGARTISEACRCCQCGTLDQPISPDVGLSVRLASSHRPRPRPSTSARHVMLPVFHEMRVVVAGRAQAAMERTIRVGGSEKSPMYIVDVRREHRYRRDRHRQAPGRACLIRNAILNVSPFSKLSL